MKLQNLQPILEAAQPKIDEMVAHFKGWYLTVFEMEASAYDIELYRIGIVSDFIGAFGRYIRVSDHVVFNNVRSEKGVLVFTIAVVRDGVENHLSTSVIIAGGYNIQRRHYRYLVNTNLRKLSFEHPAIVALKNERKRMTAEQRVMEDIKRHEAYSERTINDVKKEIGKTDDEIIPKYLKIEYESLNEYAQNNWTREEYNEKTNREIQECIRSHRSRYNEKMLNYVTRERAKERAKLDAKLEKLLIKVAC